MKKCIVLLIAAVICWSASADAAKPTEVLGPGLNSGRTVYHQDFNRVLSSDTLYYLTGTYHVDSTYSMTIPAGTIIQGDTASALVIMRGGQIFATGTACDPVVFTSRKAPGQRSPGDWGGVVILGEAPVNKVEPVIEGGIVEGRFGGSDPDDDSGDFYYVRLEWPGYRYELNNEINGLTMGGVGRGTELHHIQVSYGFDDSYEWFGGTVNAHHLIAMGGTDDEFDTDFGYTGYIQYAFGLRDPYYYDPEGSSNGFESDNDGNETSTDTPHTHPIFSNVTLIGPYLDEFTYVPPAATFKYSANLRRSTQTNILNSVIGGYPWGFTVRDPYTHQFAWNDILRVQCLSLCAQFYKDSSVPTVHHTSEWGGTPDSVTTWFDRDYYFNYAKNGAIRYLPDIGINIGDIFDPNPVPALGSEPDTAHVCINDSIWALTGFDVVDYRGAFEPGVDMRYQWTFPWANFNPQEINYVTDTRDENVTPSKKLLAQNFPNPFNPSTMIKYSVPEKGHISLNVYDASGKKVATLVNKVMAEGSYEVNFNARNLSSGMYFYRLEGEGFSETRKMVLLR
ncbi:MAG: T9SS type A sorting domain-containing protein [Candidatus Latescibacteria bacterium]|nr:T9SS type A sorting domain-containing protein [bacterium]MBD3423304.1 T9SS type A sorting domain-containing protein [Candidatus Latescibacterota bacterium]